MYFTDLRDNYHLQCDDRRYRIENKQRLNLSNHAYSILTSDIEIIQLLGISAYSGTEITSNIINHILRCFRGIAESSIALTLNKRKQELNSLLAKMSSQKERDKAISLLLESDKARLVKLRDRRCREKSFPFSFRLDVDNIEYLASTEGQAEGEFYKNNIGHYIKAVIEEYAEKPYVERERIFTKTVLDEIRLGIADASILKVTLNSTNTSQGISRNNIIYVKPYDLRQDSEYLYNYLVGLICTTKDGPWTVGAIRLSSIRHCVAQSQSAFISSEVRKEIEASIRKNGVQYLSSSCNSQKIKVQFTPEGEKLYHRILHLRPRHTAKYEKLIYEFDCTLSQAENYFFRFGHNVRILEPEALAQMFSRKYQSAAKKYQSEKNV